VKERGATTVILTNVPDISKLIEMSKMDFVIQLPPVADNEIFSALQAVIPLQMICYLTAVKRGLNPDQQILKAIDFAHELD
jgi:glucosamine 6-phosphate synthetase-like amidotransferase/phosphosugar isomerase protein